MAQRLTPCRVKLTEFPEQIVFRQFLRRDPTQMFTHAWRYPVDVRGKTRRELVVRTALRDMAADALLVDQGT